MKYISVALISSFLLVAGLFSPAYADDVTKDKNHNWTAKTINLSWHGSGVQKDMRNVVQEAEGIYSGSAQTAGNVAFTCYAGSFSVNIALKQIDMGILFTEAPDSRRRKIRRADLKINGEPIGSSDWIYMPAMKVYRARKKSTAAKLYNSAIRGSDVTMKSNGSKYTSLNLPKPDKAFRDFGSGCGMGALAKKM